MTLLGLGSSGSGQLPGLLSAFIPLHGAGVFFHQRLLQQVAHGPADVGRMLGACLSDAGAGHAGRDKVAVGPGIVGQEVQQDTVFGGDIDLGYVTRHACRVMVGVVQRFDQTSARPHDRTSSGFNQRVPSDEMPEQRGPVCFGII